MTRRWPIAHVAQPLARYARHPGQLSAQVPRMVAYVSQLGATIERLAAAVAGSAPFRMRRAQDPNAPAAETVAEAE